MSLMVQLGLLAIMLATVSIGMGALVTDTPQGQAPPGSLYELGAGRSIRSFAIAGGLAMLPTR